LSWIIREEWFWIIVLMMIAVLVLPFIIVMFILTLPPDLRLVMTILLIVGWGVAAGYKDWIMGRRKEEERKQSIEK